MELNQSSMIPFAVTDPITGTDITKNARLTAIEVGGQPSPYLKPNGDYSFTVVGADETDLTAETTFKLDVDWEGQPFPLEAKTDVTIKGTTASQLVVRIVGSFDGHERVQLTNGFIVLFQVSYKGKFLGANEVGLVNTANTNSGLGVEYKGVWEDDITHRLDIIGKELGDSKWFMTHVFRPEEPSKTAVLQGYCDVVAVGATDLRIWIEPRYRSINGVKGDKQIVFCKYYRGVLPVAYNAPGMSVRLAGNAAADDAGVKFIEALPEGLVAQFLTAPSVKTSYIINVVMVYNGVTARSGTTWYTHPGPANIPTQFAVSEKYPVLANSDENFVWQVGALNFPNIFDGSNRPTSKGAVIESGVLYSYDVVGAKELWREPFSNVPLNTLEQFVTKHAVDYRRQTYNIGNIIIKTRFEAETPLWEKQWQYGRIVDWGVMIEAAPVVFEAIPNEYTATSGKQTSIIIHAMQDRGNGPTVVPGTWTWRAGTSNITYSSITNTIDGGCILTIRGTGSIGDAQAGLNFTPTGGTVQQILVDLTAVTAGTEKVTTTALSLPAKVWDEFTVPPFTVNVAGQDVTSMIRNVQLVQTSLFIETTPGNPNKWQIVNNNNSLNRISSYFTFEVQVNGVWITSSGYGIYDVEAYNGIAFSNTVDYGLGVGAPPPTPVPKNSSVRITAWPVYKGKPMEDGFTAKMTFSGLFGPATCRAIGKADDGVGVVLEYDFPDVGTPGVERSGELVLTVDGTPGTSNGTNRWAGTFIALIVTNGLYVSPITLVPSSQPYARPYSWDAKIYHGGELLKPNDPGLSYEMSNAGATPVIIDIVGIDERYVWFALNRNPGSAGTYINRIMVTYNDGVNPIEVSGYVDVRAVFSTTTLAPVMMNPLEEPVSNSDNVIPVEFMRGTGVIGKPSIVRTLSGKNEPENGNGLIGALELIDDPTNSTRNALKFKSGWTGGKIIVSMIGDWTPTLADNWIVRDAELTVLPAPITVAQNVNKINGVKDWTNKVEFTLSQQRLIDDVLTSYNFADATITPKGTVTGAIKEAGGAVNSNGSFSVVITGNGEQGIGTVTLTVTDSDGHSYDIGIEVTAEIDSSLLVMSELTPSSITGKAGTITKMSGKTTWDTGTVLGWNNSGGGVTYTVEPEGWAEFTNPTKDNFDLKITRNSDVDISQEVFVVCNFLGMTSKQPVMVNVVKNMDANAIVQNVEVWGRYTGYPFVLKAGEEDITSTILDAKPVNDDLVIPVKMENKNNPAVNMWTIKGEGVMPARTEVVTWQYRLPTDPEGTKRTVDVVYNIAAFNGHELKIVPSAALYRTVYNGTFQADFYVYRKAEPVKETPVNLGYLNIPCVSQVSYTNFEGQGRFNLRGKNVELYDEPNTWRIRINPTGDVLGKDIAECVLQISIYNENRPTAVTKFNPNPLVGKAGVEYQLDFKVWYNGLPSDLTQAVYTDLLFYPQGILESVPGSKTKDGYKVRFVKDIDVNTITTPLDVRLNVTGGVQGRGSLTVTQQAINMKLTPAVGFQTTGQGDMENPVTLQQSVLNPE